MMHSSTYYLRAALMLAATLPMFTACDDNNETIPPFTTDPVEKPYDAYFLSEGSYGQNNSSLSALINDTLYTDLYAKANQKSLGDTGQDLLFSDGGLFVTVSTSGYMAKLDIYGVELTRLDFDAATLGSPRYMVREGSYLYVTLYGGYVAKVDAYYLTLVDTCQVGAYPEQLALVDGRLVVCNSGYGYGNTLSVINLDSFTVEQTLTVDLNPTRILTGENGKGYYLTTSYDASWTATVALHELDPKDWSSRTVQTFAGKEIRMANAGQALYLAESATTDYTNYTTTFSQVNYATGTYTATSFLNDADLTAELSNKNVYMLAVDTAVGNIYVATSNYTTNSSLYVISDAGVLQSKFADAGGVNMSAAAFSTESVSK